eukprot:SM000123S25820  [mRNA]  locus=s123:21392:24280:+ [translate_table: standard]
MWKAWRPARRAARGLARLQCFGDGGRGPASGQVALLSAECRVPSAERRARSFSKLVQRIIAAMAGRRLQAAERAAARQLWCVPPATAAVPWPVPRSGARVHGTAATIESWRLPPTAHGGHGAARGLPGSPLQLNAEDGPERDEEAMVLLPSSIAEQHPVAAACRRCMCCCCRASLCSPAMSQQLNPFALVEEELAMLAKRMRTMVSSEVPKLATAAEYFFGLNAQGKRFRPAVLLLMASAFSGVAVPPVRPPLVQPWDDLLRQRERQQRIAEITEMIHVASLLHDDVLDLAETRRGVKSLNYLMGNKLAVLAGDFLLARASVALASLQNTDVVELLSRVLEHLVSGEIMQMTAEPHQCCSMEYYLHKTFCKTGSLIANGCKAVAILGNQPPAVAELAYSYGRHLGLAFQLVDDALDFTGSLVTLGKPALSDLRQGLATAPTLLAAEEYPAMLDLVRRKFVSPGDIDQALAWVRDSRGIERTHQLAAEHAAKAAAAVDAFPPAASDNAGTLPLCLVLALCRRALLQMTQLVLTRTK